MGFWDSLVNGLEDAWNQLTHHNQNNQKKSQPKPQPPTRKNLPSGYEDYQNKQSVQTAPTPDNLNKTIPNLGNELNKAGLNAPNNTYVTPPSQPSHHNNYSNITHKSYAPSTPSEHAQAAESVSSVTNYNKQLEQQKQKELEKLKQQEEVNKQSFLSSASRRAWENTYEQFMQNAKAKGISPTKAKAYWEAHQEEIKNKFSDWWNTTGQKQALKYYNKNYSQQKNYLTSEFTKKEIQNPFQVGMDLFQTQKKMGLMFQHGASLSDVKKDLGLKLKSTHTKLKFFGPYGSNEKMITNYTYETPKGFTISGGFSQTKWGIVPSNVINKMDEQYAIKEIHKEFKEHPIKSTGKVFGSAFLFGPSNEGVTEMAKSILHHNPGKFSEWLWQEPTIYRTKVKSQPTLEGKVIEFGKPIISNYAVQGLMAEGGGAILGMGKEGISTIPTVWRFANLHPLASRAVSWGINAGLLGGYGYVQYHGAKNKYQMLRKQGESKTNALIETIAPIGVQSSIVLPMGYEGYKWGERVGPPIRYEHVKMINPKTNQAVFEYKGLVKGWGGNRGEPLIGKTNMGWKLGDVLPSVKQGEPAKWYSLYTNQPEQGVPSPYETWASQKISKELPIKETVGLAKGAPEGKISAEQLTKIKTKYMPEKVSKELLEKKLPMLAKKYHVTFHVYGSYPTQAQMQNIYGVSRTPGDIDLMVQGANDEKARAIQQELVSFLNARGVNAQAEQGTFLITKGSHHLIDLHPSSSELTQYQTSPYAGMGQKPFGEFKITKGIKGMKYNEEIVRKGNSVFANRWTGKEWKFGPEEWRSKDIIDLYKMAEVEGRTDITQALAKYYKITPKELSIYGKGRVYLGSVGPSETEIPSLNVGSLSSAITTEFLESPSVPMHNAYSPSISIPSRSMPSISVPSVSPSKSPSTSLSISPSKSPSPSLSPSFSPSVSPSISPSISSPSISASASPSSPSVSPSPSLSPSFSPSFSPSTTPPAPNIPVAATPIIFPFGGFGGKIKFGGQKKYTPSPIAVFKGIKTTKMPTKKMWTGLEIRPIVVRKKSKSSLPKFMGLNLQGKVKNMLTKRMFSSRTSHKRGRKVVRRKRRR